MCALEFPPEGPVRVQPLHLPTEVLYNLEDNLLLFFTGYMRSASQILSDQNQRSLAGERTVEDNLLELKELAARSLAALEAGQLDDFARLLTKQWEHKKRRSPDATTAEVDRWFALGMANGARGGKLVGAGGGGFLMFYAEEKARVRHAMFEAGLREVRFRFDFEGCDTVTQS